jgi:hypothetical protein
MEWYEYISAHLTEILTGGVLAIQTAWITLNKMSGNKLATNFGQLDSKILTLDKSVERSISSVDSKVTSLGKVVFDKMGDFEREMSRQRTMNQQMAQENIALSSLVVVLASNLNVPLSAKQDFFKGLSSVSTITTEVQASLKAILSSQESVLKVETAKQTEIEQEISGV